MRFQTFAIVLACTGVALAEPQSLLLNVGQEAALKGTSAQVKLLAFKGKKAVVKVGGKERSLEPGEWSPVGQHLFWIESLDVGRKVPVIAKCALAPAQDQAKAWLASYGWHVTGPSTSHSDTVPRDLSGLPWTHYRLASESAGMALELGGGRKIELLRFPLREKDTSGGAAYAHLATLRGRIIGAWLSSDSPRAPGIYPVNSKKL